jgi:hypothetical protein
MSNLLSPAPLVKPPSSIIPYFDRIPLWQCRPIDRATRKMLLKHCRELEVIDGYACWDRNWNFKQRLDIKGPDEVALRWIAARRDGRINCLEVALDYIWDTEEWREACWEHFHRHLARRYHRLLQGIQFHDGNPLHGRYDAPRGTPNLITIYRQDYCRITEQPCYVLHVEWRATGIKAVHAAGILRPRDLLTFNFRAFWKERLRFYTVDPERLGRMFLNRQSGTRRRRITPQDRAEGEDALRPYATMQELIDFYNPGRIGRILTPLDVEPFLPPSHYLSYMARSYPNCDYPNDFRKLADKTAPLVTISHSPLASRMTITSRSPSYVSSDVSGKE